MQNRKCGISLVVLTITIIVVSIITAVTISIIEKQDMINNSKETIFNTNIATIKEMAYDIYTDLEINMERGTANKLSTETVSEYIERKLVEQGADENIVNKLIINNDGTITVPATLEY